MAYALTEQADLSLTTPQVSTTETATQDPFHYVTKPIDDLADQAAEHLTLRTDIKPLDRTFNKLTTVVTEILRQQALSAVKNFQTPDIKGSGQQIENTMIDSGINASFEALRETGLPFLRNLELEQRIRRGDKPQFNIRSIDSLYESRDLRHTTFAEGGLARNGDDRTTLNIGFGHRYMTADESWLYGMNFFYDRQWPTGHQRASLGLEATTADFDLFANRYVPLSNWKDSRSGYEEVVLGGWDVGISGRIPHLPKVEATGSAFSWQQREGEQDSNGLKLAVEYTPFTMMTLGFSTAYDTEGRSTTEARIRYNLNSEKTVREQMRKSVRDLRLQKVHRENEIRVFERQASALTGNVTETVGANTVTLNDGTTLALTVGRKILYGNRITVENSVGAYAQLVFGDGASLRIGTDSQVRIDQGLITLISGVMQYVSGSTNVVINTPGGTITLLGTDVDVVSNGTSSSVSVRDGQIQTGGLTASVGQVVSMNGAPSLLPPGTAGYTAHRTAVFNRLDSIDPSPLTIAKAAPYIYDDPFVQQSPFQVGDNLVLGLRFSKPVTASGAVRLDFTINGSPRSATFTSGNGSNTLLFTYTTQGGDAGQSQLVIDSLVLAGGSIAGTATGAISYVAPVTVDLPNGPIQATNPSVIVATAASSPTGTSPIPFTLTFSSAVTGLLANELTVTNGTASNLATGNNITYTVDITPTAQGTVSVQVPAGVAQSSVGGFNNLISNTVNIVYDTGAPAGYAVNFTTDPVNAGNAAAAAFQLTGAEVGTTYNYTISSSGGGTNVTGSGTVSTATQNFTGLNLSGLNDGTLTVSLTLTDALLNVGAAATDTVAKDVVAPTISSVTPPANGTYDDL